MGYRFARGRGRASVVVGSGLFVLALLLASWLGFSNDAEFERFSPAVRILAALVVILVGLFVGGTRRCRIPLLRIRSAASLTGVSRSTTAGFLVFTSPTFMGASMGPPFMALAREHDLEPLPGHRGPGLRLPVAV